VESRRPLPLPHGIRNGTTLAVVIACGLLRVFMRSDPDPLRPHLGNRHPPSPKCTQPAAAAVVETVLQRNKRARTRWCHFFCSSVLSKQTDGKTYPNMNEQRQTSDAASRPSKSTSSWPCLRYPQTQKKIPPPSEHGVMGTGRGVRGGSRRVLVSPLLVRCILRPLCLGHCGGTLRMSLESSQTSRRVPGWGRHADGPGAQPFCCSPADPSDLVPEGGGGRDWTSPPAVTRGSVVPSKHMVTWPGWQGGIISNGSCSRGHFRSAEAEQFCRAQQHSQ
jgi:hypothetical protein